MTESLIIIVVAAVVMTMISSSIISMTHAQQAQISGSKSGTIASLQYALGATSRRLPRRGWVPEGFFRVGCRRSRYNGYTRSNKDVPAE